MWAPPGLRRELEPWVRRSFEKDIIQGKMTQDRTLRNGMFRAKRKDLPDGVYRKLWEHEKQVKLKGKHRVHTSLSSSAPRRARERIKSMYPHAETCV